MSFFDNLSNDEYIELESNVFEILYNELKDNALIYNSKNFYDKLTNTIRYKNEIFTSLSQFKWAHYINHNPDLKGKKDTYGNAWVLCEYEKDNEWISTFELLN